MNSYTKREILPDEKKSIMLSIMDEIDSYCREHHIEYYLVGGTLLGAIRHKGFIPWDDDMDIGLSRKDYNRLISEFNSKSGNVQIADYKNTAHYKWASAKAYDNRTVLIELGDTKNVTGVFVDLFPLDGIIGEKKTVQKEVLRKKRWKDILTLKHLKIDEKRPMYKNLIVLLGRVLYLIPDTFLIKQINASDKNPIAFEKCRYVCNFCGAWGIRELTKSRNFMSAIDAEFEGRKYRIPIGYDDYLKTVYGEYMSPPPKEKQVSHHSSVSYWKE